MTERSAPGSRRPVQAIPQPTLECLLKP